MSTLEGFFLVAAGVFAGFINSIAGGGSLLIMPLLIFMGLPSSEANGTNRVAIFIQNIFSVAGYRSKGIYVFPFAIYVAIPAIIGAIIGSNIAVDISDKLFNRILAIVMLIVMVISIFRPSINIDPQELFTRKKNLAKHSYFFLPRDLRWIYTSRNRLSYYCYTYKHSWSRHGEDQQYQSICHFMLYCCRGDCLLHRRKDPLGVRISISSGKFNWCLDRQ